MQWKYSSLHAYYTHCKTNKKATLRSKNICHKVVLIFISAWKISIKTYLRKLNFKLSKLDSYSILSKSQVILCTLHAVSFHISYINFEQHIPSVQCNKQGTEQHLCHFFHCRIFWRKWYLSSSCSQRKISL